VSISPAGFSAPVGPVQSVQSGIHPIEKTLDLGALVGTRGFVKAAEQVLLLRQQLSNGRHPRRYIVMLQHWRSRIGSLLLLSPRDQGGG
jgi:hypothetical protein